MLAVTTFESYHHKSRLSCGGDIPLPPPPLSCRWLDCRFLVNSLPRRWSSLASHSQSHASMGSWAWPTPPYLWPMSRQCLTKPWLPNCCLRTFSLFTLAGVVLTLYSWGSDCSASHVHVQVHWPRVWPLPPGTYQQQWEGSWSWGARIHSTTVEIFTMLTSHAKLTGRLKWTGEEEGVQCLKEPGS